MAERPVAGGGVSLPNDGATTLPSSRFLRPRYVFPALLLAIVVTVLLTPADVGRRGDPRLTTRSAESQGARALFELASRLGWRASRRETALSALAGSRKPVAPLDTAAVYAVLDPPTELTAAEVGTLLAAVRRGAGLLVVLSPRSALADSLGLRPSRGGAAQVTAEGRDSPDSCPPNSSKKGAIDWPGSRVYSYWLEARPPLPPGLVTFARVEPATSFQRRAAAQRAAARRAAQRRAAARSDSARDSAGAEDEEYEEYEEEEDDDALYETIVDDGAAPRLAAAGDTVADSSDAASQDDSATGRMPDVKVGDVTFSADSVIGDFATGDSVAGLSDALAAVADSLRAGSAGTDSVRRRSEPNRTAIVGFPFGEGRIVAVADPDWLRNDVLRVCAWNAGVQAVRMLEYLARGRPAARVALVFDEYHQGFGHRPSTLRAIRRALTEDARGRALAQALVAALVLIAALAPRPSAPRPTARLTRRSPLEHVEALARAYAQIGATRLATRRLVRGIRRRHGGWGTALGGTPRGGAGIAGGESDDDFLAAVAERFPEVAADVALLRDAMRTQRTPAQMLDVGRAAERVELQLAGRASPARASAPRRRPTVGAPAAAAPEPAP